MKVPVRSCRLKAVIIALIALLVFVPAPRSDAYLLTEDIPNLTHNIVSQVQNLAQYTATVTNTLHTYTTTAQQLQQFYNYLSMFGNPAQVAGMLGLSQEYRLLNGLRNAQTIQQAMSSLNGASSYSYTGNGVFAPLATVNQWGQAIQRTAQAYNPYALVEKSFQQYQTTASQVAQNQTTLAQEYQNTLNQITSATSAAQVEKLAQKAAAIKALMDANQAQVNNAVSQVGATSQMIQVEAQKQAQAQMEQYLQQRTIPGDANIQTGSFNLYGNGQNLPTGPVWLGQ
jgi:DNA repair exonuclease SbcCD ATPase subunit